MAKKIQANAEAVEAIVMKVGNMGCTADQAYRLIMAAGHDVAARRAREAGRSVWNRGDYNAACRFTTSVFKAIGLVPAGA
jgi:hypothetical protein